eukprot:363721-Chlamydomonas_euryale.AAC.2
MHHAAGNERGGHRLRRKRPGRVLWEGLVQVRWHAARSLCHPREQRARRPRRVGQVASGHLCPCARRSRAVCGVWCVCVCVWKPDGSELHDGPDHLWQATRRVAHPDGQAASNGSQYHVRLGIPLLSHGRTPDGMLCTAANILASKSSFPGSDQHAMPLTGGRRRQAWRSGRPPCLPLNAPLQTSCWSQQSKPGAVTNRVTRTSPSVRTLERSRPGHYQRSADCPKASWTIKCDFWLNHSSYQRLWEAASPTAGQSCRGRTHSWI